MATASQLERPEERQIRSSVERVCFGLVIQWLKVTSKKGEHRLRHIDSVISLLLHA